MTNKDTKLKLSAPITLFVAVVLIQGIGTFAFLKKFKSANFLGLTIATLPLQLYCVYRICAQNSDWFKFDQNLHLFLGNKTLKREFHAWQKLAVLAGFAAVVLFWIAQKAAVAKNGPVYFTAVVVATIACYFVNVGISYTYMYLRMKYAAYLAGEYPMEYERCCAVMRECDTQQRRFLFPEERYAEGSERLKKAQKRLRNRSDIVCALEMKEKYGSSYVVTEADKKKYFTKFMEKKQNLLNSNSNTLTLYEQLLIAPDISLSEKAKYGIPLTEDEARLLAEWKQEEEARAKIRVEEEGAKAREEEANAKIRAEEAQRERERREKDRIRRTDSYGYVVKDPEDIVVRTDKDGNEIRVAFTNLFLFYFQDVEGFDLSSSIWNNFGYESCDSTMISRYEAFCKALKVRAMKQPVHDRFLAKLTAKDAFYLFQYAEKSVIAPLDKEAVLTRKQFSDLCYYAKSYDYPDISRLEKAAAYLSNLAQGMQGEQKVAEQIRLSLQGREGQPIFVNENDAPDAHCYINAPVNGNGKPLRAEIDHLIVAPCGIIHIETKTRAGEPHVHGNGSYYFLTGNGTEKATDAMQVTRHDNVIRMVVGDIPRYSIICFASDSNQNIIYDDGVKPEYVQFATLPELSSVLDRLLTDKTKDCLTAEDVKAVAQKLRSARKYH